MIRVLVMIAAAGFLVSLASLTAAVMIGGPELLESAAWGGWSPHWVHRMDHVERWDSRDGGAQTSRELAWSGGDTLDLDVPADVTYTQAPGPAKVTVTGPERLVSEVEIDGGHIGWSHHHRHMHWGDLQITMSAPNVTRFELSGSGRLAISGYKQDKLDLDISGNADVTATGETGALGLDVSGSGDADLSGLKAKDARVDIQGSGDAKLAPTDSAKVDISGSGDVTLLTHPARLDTDISGSGSLHQKTPEASAPAPAPAPAKPAPKKGKSA
jgi:hypothetical protein